MDAVIRLAEAIELKYREQYMKDGLIKQEWLIHQIIKLLRKYPKLIELISADMSIEKILSIINAFIAQEIEKRDLQHLNKLRHVLTEKWQCRSQETLLLLLLLGYCFHRSVKRMTQNRVREGEYFKPYISEITISHLAYPMPVQVSNYKLVSIIKHVSESSCSSSDIQNEVEDLIVEEKKMEKNEKKFVNKTGRFKF